MKKLFFLFICLSFSSLLLAQAPQGFNYQGVARDLSGNILPNRDLSFKIGIVKGAVDGTIVYQEIHFATTNNLGLFNIQIGTGAVEVGPFEDIDWGSGLHFVRIEMDEEGGGNFELLGTSQLLSVPYALYAENSGNSPEEFWKENETETGIEYDGGNVSIGTSEGTAVFEINDSMNAPVLAAFPTLFSSRIAEAEGDFFALHNGTLIPNQFVPTLRGNIVTGPRTALFLYGSTSDQFDSPNLPAIVAFTSRINNSGTGRDVVNRNLFEWKNNETELMVLDPQGNLGLNTLNPQARLHIARGGTLSIGPPRQSSLLELNVTPSLLPIIDIYPTVFSARPEGTGNDYFAIHNGTLRTDQFVSTIRGNRSSAAETALFLFGSTDAVHDIPNRPAIMAFTSRINNGSSGTTVVNRNLFEWSNNTNVHMVLGPNGNLGLGTDAPKSKVQISTGDVYIEDINSGVIMRSPDGNCWRIQVNNSGALVPTSITCPN